MYNFLQISMNVLKVHMAVLRHVLIKLVVIPVLVVLVIA